MYTTEDENCFCPLVLGFGNVGPLFWKKDYYSSNDQLFYSLGTVLEKGTFNWADFDPVASMTTSKANCGAGAAILPQTPARKQRAHWTQ